LDSGGGLFPVELEGQALLLGHAFVLADMAAFFNERPDLFVLDCLGQTQFYFHLFHQFLLVTRLPGSAALHHLEQDHAQREDVCFY
jgi:hypothetical protein